MSTALAPRPKRTQEVLIRNTETSGVYFLWADEHVANLVRQMDGVVLVVHRGGPIYKIVVDLRYDASYIFEQVVLLAACDDYSNLPN